MITYRIHAALGQTDNSDVLVSDTEIHQKFNEEIQRLIIRLRGDHPRAHINLLLDCDVSIDHTRTIDMDHPLGVDPAPATDTNEDILE